MQYARSSEGDVTLFIDDPAVHELYDDLIDKSLTYVVSAVKFLSFSTRGDMHIPTYLPKEKIKGFNTLYNPKIDDISHEIYMSEDNPHPYVQNRIKNELSLRTMDAYREIYDGNGRIDDIRYKIFPVHHLLRAHFDDTVRDNLHPLCDINSADAFIHQGCYTRPAPSFDAKKNRLMFFAETFRAQVGTYYGGNGRDLVAFDKAVDDQEKAVTEAAKAFNVLTKTIKLYL